MFEENVGFVLLGVYKVSIHKISLINFRDLCDLCIGELSEFFLELGCSFTNLLVCCRRRLVAHPLVVDVVRVVLVLTSPVIGALNFVVIRLVQIFALLRSLYQPRLLSQLSRIHFRFTSFRINFLIIGSLQPNLLFLMHRVTLFLFSSIASD